ncbi:hypothetical protein Tco_1475307 [Tanacetum coccineum]
MMAAGGNIMRKTPQEAYDLIKNMTLHHFQWNAEVYYDTSTSVSAHYSETTSLLSAQIEVLEKQIAYISQNLQHQPGLGHPHTVYYSDSDESDEDEPLEAEKSKINPLIREPSDAFLIGDKEIKFNPLKDIDDLVPIPRVSEKPLDSLDPISKTFDITITNPLFDFDFEFTLNSDNPIFDIQNEESDESKTETIMEEVQIHSSQTTAQILPPYGKLTFDLTMPKPILTFSHFRYGIFGSYRVFNILGPRILFSLSYGFGLVFPDKFSKLHSLELFKAGDQNKVFDPRIIVVDVDSKVGRNFNGY